MKISKSKEIISYAAAFISFVLPKIEVDEIILFGSSARGEAAKESDIDIFFNTKTNQENTKKIIKQELDKFYKSSLYEQYVLRGIKNLIHIEIGDLEKWKLKRSIISEGIVLYGKYKSTPEKLKAYLNINIKPIKNIAKRNRIIRKLIGRKENNYQTEGLIKQFEGRQLAPTTFILPLEKSSEIIKFLSSEKIDFQFFEFWTDQIT